MVDNSHNTPHQHQIKIYPWHGLCSVKLGQPFLTRETRKKEGSFAVMPLHLQSNEEEETLLRWLV